MNTIYTKQYGINGLQILLDNLSDLQTWLVYNKDDFLDVLQDLELIVKQIKEEAEEL